MKPIVIIGGGPAGMMLAYQLAANGLPVRVFERHADFDREFRGEFVQPSVLAALEKLGMLEALRANGRLLPIRAIVMRGRNGRSFASNIGVNGEPVSEAVHQPSFLGLLDERARRFADYQLTMNASVTRLVREGERVTGVVVSHGGREEQVDAELVVVCTGRSSALRKDAGLSAIELEPSYELLWLRFDTGSRPDLYPDSLEGYVTARSYYVRYPTHGRRVQLMWRRRRDCPLDVKSPVEVLKRELLSDAPAVWHPFIEALFDERTERQKLKVVADRLNRWWAPGVLFLGDAAHTMSPMGAQGLNMAIRDAIVAGNHLIRAHRESASIGDDSLLAAIEAERRPEIERMQAVQARMSKVQDAPRLVQALLTNVVIPLATRLQGASYLREIQYGVTDVRFEFQPAS
jgi:2-polyprenyl-6-methoxyphenol hydroxylase-like FAD-dependent oxidoreductase